jgi:glycosyltransferase involved in cell wall biosynthesis
MRQARRFLRVSLTNVTGLGATILAKSLLPALEAAPNLTLETLYTPASGELTEFCQTIASRSEIYHRRAPKALSRVLECTLLSHHFDGNTPLLVMGDLPLATTAPQIVLVQSPHIVGQDTAIGFLDHLRYKVARAIFRINMNRVSAFVVQSDVMRNELLANYNIACERVHVIQQPPPTWLLESNLHRTGPVHKRGYRLRLFYPAAYYPHKNHRLLARTADSPLWVRLIERLTLTIESSSAPASAEWIVCTGELATDSVIEAYRESDALLFLSKSESYGFPLVEAMWIGLPIVCPDIQYARFLCGDQAIYFDPDDLESLYMALVTLRERIDAGWWPDWFWQLQKLPSNWAAVAEEFSQIVAAIC